MGRAALPFIRKIRTKLLHWASCWLIPVKKQYFTGVVCLLKYISWLLSNKLAHIPYVWSWSGDAAPLQGNEQRPGEGKLYFHQWHQHLCIAPEDRVYFFCLYFVYLTFVTVVLHFIFAVCVMKSKHFSRVSWDHFPIQNQFLHSSWSRNRTKSENKSHLLLYPWSKCASIHSFLFLPDNARKYLPVFFQSCMWMKYLPINYCIHQQK